MLTRRSLLKAGLYSGAAVALPTGCTNTESGPGKHRIGVAVSRDAIAPSPPTTPFVMDLPIPPPPQEVAPFASPPNAHLIGPGTKFYEIIEEEHLVQIHPQLPPTLTWGYRDIHAPRSNVPSANFAVGPTFRAQMATGPGQGVIVRQHNQLPANHQGFGVPFTTVHLHGGHVESRSDGFPTLDFGPGESYDYGYPMRVPGFSTGTPTNDIPSTIWYHDHLIDFTRQNVYRGLTGFYLVFDALDTGDELTGLHLPSGPFDVPLLVQDKSFAADGSLVYDVFNHKGFLGDKLLVNGAIQPRFHVQRRKYRFRFLDGSNARFYQIFLANAGGKTFTFDQIATDGGLLSAPIRGIESFRLAPALRVEIVVDFTKFNPGDEVYFENRLEQTDGRRPGELLPRGPQLLKLIVGDTVPDPSQVPDVLRPFAPIPPSVLAVATRRTFEFNRQEGAWAINGLLAGDLSVPIAQPQLGRPEIWHLVNGGGGWAHPIHVHLDQMRVLTRNGKLPPLDERDGVARRDTVILGPDDEVEVFLEFKDFKGPYVFHCHNLEHEDMAMMARFDTI